MVCQPVLLRSTLESTGFESVGKMLSGFDLIVDIEHTEQKCSVGV